jgi:signal transduction histidine kinase
VTETLRRVPLFSELPEHKLDVVLEGETEWTRKVGGQDVFVVELGEGSVFAELILVLDAPYPTTGHAVTPVRLFELDVPSFWEMLRICSEVLRGILATAVERAELHESVSQQHAKLISLGTIAAGLAHELNNPAAAVGRSAQEAREAFRESSLRAVKLGEIGMSLAERAYVAGLPDEVAEQAEGVPALDSLERSDKEDGVAIWLEDHGFEEAWDLSPTLVGAGLDVDWLEGLADRLSDEASVGDVLAWLVSEITGDVLMREIQQASARISELVGAVKSYSHRDQTSQNEADMHEGLDNTLVMLGHKLKKGDVRVTREYEEDMPRVCAHGSELNQIWTNLIDNAIDAVHGAGNVKIRTARENDRVLVEISDDGPGIPDEIRDRIFEPFFTTKDVGKGTGLGLDISYRVVEKLGGDICVLSEPGATRFQLRLPIDATVPVEAPRRKSER